MKKSESPAFLRYTLPERQLQKAACISPAMQVSETVLADPAHQANSSTADQSIQLLARLLGRQAAHEFTANIPCRTHEQTNAE